MSTDLQEDSPITQGQHTAAFIAEQQIPPWTRTYFDLAISGGTVDKRPGIMTLLTEAERLRPTCVVFYKLDRAFRNNFEQGAALRRLKKLGIRVLKVRDPNMEGPQGEFMDNILGAVNQFERELTGTRIRDHNQAMAQRGEWPGGSSPYGYQYRKPVVETHGRKRTVITPGGLEPDPIEWTIARQIWDWALAGYRKVEIVDLANQAGFRRRNGKLWSAHEILKMLRSKTYAGYVPYGLHSQRHGRSRREEAAEWHTGKHQAMVTYAEFLHVQSTTNSQTGQRRAHRHARAELAGLIRCRLCGGPVTAGNYDKGGYYYLCPTSLKHGAEHPYWIRRDWVIHLALQAIVDDVIASLPAIPPIGVSEAGREAILKEIERLRNQVRRLRTLYEVGEYGDDLAEYTRRKREIEVQIAHKETNLAAAGPSSEDLTARWSHLRQWEQLYEAADTVQSKQRLWASVIERVNADSTQLVVTLRDFGPTVHRQWEVTLPPLRCRRPGTTSGRGIVGQGKSKSYMVTTGLAPRPVTSV